MHKNILTVVGITILLLGIGINPSTGTIVEKTSSTALGSPGYIQDLIDNASDGDTIYIPNGTYYEHIVIHKSINLIGEDKNTTIIDGENETITVVSITADWVNISGFTIQNSSCAYGGYTRGIWIQSNHTSIRGNNIFYHQGGRGFIFGIDIGGNYNTISGNNISHNGIGIGTGSWSKYNNITGNYISYGPLFFCGENTYNVIKNNIIINAHIILSYASNNIIKSNVISNPTGPGIDFLAGECNNNTIINNNILNNREGISTFYVKSNNNSIINNYISKNNYGISLFGENNHISGNNIINNDYGLDLVGHNNSITCNNISNNNYGLVIGDYSGPCFNNTIYHNNFIENSQNAIDKYSNIWDDGKYGNYWSDYEEKYPDAKKKWWKGIWDTPYEIEGGDNQDNCPLIKQWPETASRTITKDKAINRPFLSFLQNYPNMFPIFRQLLGLLI